MKPHKYTISEEAAKASGFAGFNNYPHLCVEVPDGGFTISARTSEDRLVTFAFCPFKEGGPPQCVDIHHHTSGVTEGGTPIQSLSVRGKGPLIHVSKYDDNPPATLTILNLQPAGTKDVTGKPI